MRCGSAVLKAAYAALRFTSIAMRAILFLRSFLPVPHSSIKKNGACS